jgi:hypothetical protein
VPFKYDIGRIERHLSLNLSFKYEYDVFRIAFGDVYADLYEDVLGDVRADSYEDILGDLLRDLLGVIGLSIDLFED